jgi:hypothetical protein
VLISAEALFKAFSTQEVKWNLRWKLAILAVLSVISRMRGRASAEASTGLGVALDNCRRAA